MFTNGKLTALRTGNALSALGRFCRVLLLLFLAQHFIAGHAYSREIERQHNILIIKSGNATVYDKVINAIEHYFILYCESHPDICTEVDTTSSIPTNLKPEWSKHSDLIITLGSKAAKFTRDHGVTNKTIHAMIPMLPDKKSNISDRLFQETDTIYLNQPLERNLRLAKLSTGGGKRIGILVHKNNRPSESILRKSENKLGITITLAEAVNSRELGSKLGKLLESSDVLLALPDANIHNRKTISNILTSTYRKQVPVVGFSAAYVKAGAISAVHSTPDDIARHIVDVSASHLSTKTNLIKGPKYPKYFSVSVNRKVARSLGIKLPSETHLRDQISTGKTP
ncbi:MAG: hypothetical protein OI74_16745 [Gammaproteobacteria bacterium (ex Lamellibrachia satsuma)]|nr:MAG: hypothetical protein HPY30_04275 [Gammaproteobacteria bacterium (ex Lamellibrachia satsuma)]RRS30513.1 MAG: hypothetical protein OI74_16745 [Gammaproteobacteria bacterium (ex Lamellibrachia satsuma)]RRS36874.1 MAG: hypothetical protein NV67_04615 [Gammaproteobacteria bacterium (ex Lamellibrachia satsuma)]